MCSNGNATEAADRNAPTVAKNDQRCRFPFVYQNVTYYECTSIDNGGVPWCFVESDLGDAVWGDCKHCSGMFVRFLFNLLFFVFSFVF